jgi:hypothetical protein
MKNMSICILATIYCKRANESGTIRVFLVYTPPAAAIVSGEFIRLFAGSVQALTPLIRTI